MQKVGSGIFGWNGRERRSQRYGNFNLCNRDYNETAVARIELDLPALRELDGRRVRLSCTITETRTSGHVGDKHLGIQPTTPDVGATIELGVGYLCLGAIPAWENTVTTSVGLEPEDGRTKFWLDPRVLYRLHDQTVDLYVEETTALCHDAPAIEPSVEGAKALEDGFIQIVSAEDVASVRIQPKFTKLGDGLFSMGFDYEPGEDIPMSRG